MRIASFFRDHPYCPFGEFDFTVNDQNARTGTRQQNCSGPPVSNAITGGTAAGHDGTFSSDAEIC